MLLLDGLTEVGDGYIICEVVVRSDGLFDAAGRVPSMLGLEYMAQAVSAYSGLQAQGSPIKIGLLLGTRRFETNVASFPCGETLAVKVSPVVYGKDGLGAFDCAVSGESILQTARLVVFEPTDVDAYLDSSIHA